MIRISLTRFKKITHSTKFNSQKVINGKNLPVTKVKRAEESSELNFLTKITNVVIRQANVTSVPYEVRLEICHSQRFFVSVKHIYSLQ